MMSLNRFRLKHLLKRHRAARRAAQLLERPDRLIGLILIGNNAVNILAALVAGQLGTRWFGEAAGLWLTTGLLTIVMLVFAEVTPKTIAAVHPERIAFPASRVIKVLSLVLYPLVVFINWITNALVKLMGIDPTKLDEAHLSSEELRTVVDEAGQLIPDQHQDMLLSILDLEKISVNDIMIPRNEIVGLDLDSPIEELQRIVLDSKYTRLPVYQGDINKVIGVLHTRSVNRILKDGQQALSVESIKRFSEQPYFAPENTKLSKQLLNFQKSKSRVGFVVDEYGDIEGLITLDDLLEEIVGDYTTSDADDDLLIESLGPNQYLIDGTALIRDINKETGWKLPVSGSRTLNGLALEQLEDLPEGAVSFNLGNYRAEATKIGDKVINKLRIWESKRSKREEST
jgi:Mg2+/Co2+ transporter CorB